MTPLFWWFRGLIRLLSKKTTSIAVQTCRRRFNSDNSCESCDTEDDYERLERFGVVQHTNHFGEVDREHLEWRQSRTTINRSKVLYRRDRNRDKTGFIHNFVWNHDNTFTTASVHVPAQNLENFLGYQWAALSVDLLGYIRALPNDPYGTFARHRMVNNSAFKLVYYKCCLSIQLFQGEVYGKEYYEPLYNHMVRQVLLEFHEDDLSDENPHNIFTIPHFEELHEIDNGNNGQFDAKVRRVIMSLAKLLTKMGFPIRLPFCTPTNIYNRPAEGTFDVVKCAFTTMEWEHNFLLREIIMFIKPNGMFKDLQLPRLEPRLTRNV